MGVRAEGQAAGRRGGRKSSKVDKSVVQREEKLTVERSQQTGYPQLDQQIANTKAKKGKLLGVLPQPATPLHNNPAELAVRKWVRKRDIRFGPAPPLELRLGIPS